MRETLRDLFGTSDEKLARAPVVAPVEMVEPVKLGLSEQRRAILEDRTLSTRHKAKMLRELHAA